MEEKGKIQRKTTLMAESEEDKKLPDEGERGE